MTPPPDREFALSLVRDDLLFRLQRRIGLIPPEGLGIARRAVFWTAVAWLPITVWAALTGRLTGGVEEPLLRHFTVHARLLIGVPVMILGEGLAHRVMTTLIPEFVRSGIVPDETVPRFREVLAGVAGLRNATLPWLVILALVLTGVGVGVTMEQADELNWAQLASPGGGLGFGGWWLVLVGRPIFLTLLLSWLWRLVLLFILLRRVSALPLSIVPTHADRAGGLGFLQWMPQVFAPVIFAISVVLSASWGHQVRYHGVHVLDLRIMMGALVGLVVVLFLAPFVGFAGRLARTRRQALIDYGALLVRHGGLVRQRWVERIEVPDDPVLSAPELGPVADINAAYDAVRQMKPVPLGLPSVAMLVVPAVLPMLPVIAMEVPLAELLGGLVKALL